MKFDKEKIIINEIELVEVFNNHYINTVEESSRKKARHVARDNNNQKKRTALQVMEKVFWELSKY